MAKTLCARCNTHPRHISASGKTLAYCRECNAEYYREYKRSRKSGKTAAPVAVPTQRPSYRICVVCGNVGPQDAFVADLCICRGCSNPPPPPAPQSDDAPRFSIRPFRHQSSIEHEAAPEADAEADDFSDVRALILSETRTIPLLSHDEHVALMQRIAAGDDEAFGLMVRHNLRLVWGCMLRYFGRLDLDLFQAGCMGLMHAIRKYDHTRGTRFSTYAVWWIRQHMRREIERADLIRIPSHMHDKLMAARNRSLRRGGDASPEELAAATDNPVWVIEHMLRAQAEPVSIDAIISTKRGEHSLDEFIADAAVLDPDAAAEEADTLRCVDDLLTRLPPRKREMWLLYHLHDYKYGDLSERYGVSRQRVQQVVSEVSDYLRSNAAYIPR